MTSVSMGDAKDHLSEYVSEVERTHDRVTITRHGKPAAVLVAVDDMAGMEETVDILSTPGELGAIREGIRQAERGDYVDSEELKARYGFRPSA